MIDQAVSMKIANIAPNVLDKPKTKNQIQLFHMFVELAIFETSIKTRSLWGSWSILSECLIKETMSSSVSCGWFVCWTEISIVIGIMNSFVIGSCDTRVHNKNKLFYNIWGYIQAYFCHKNNWYNSYIFHTLSKMIQSLTFKLFHKYENFHFFP